MERNLIINRKKERKKEGAHSFGAVANKSSHVFFSQMALHVHAWFDILLCSLCYHDLTGVGVASQVMDPSLRSFRLELDQSHRSKASCL
jgi:hypothetical protein